MSQLLSPSALRDLETALGTPARCLADHNENHEPELTLDDLDAKPQPHRNHKGGIRGIGIPPGRSCIRIGGWNCDNPFFA
jgi:hypothetical protein